MKHLMKKAISVFLIMSMIASSVCVCFAAEEEKPYTVLIIGDSTNVGFGTKAFFTEPAVNGTCIPKKSEGFNCISGGSIPDLLNQYLETAHPGYKLYQYGISGLRVYDTRFFLDNNYPSDAHFNRVIQEDRYDGMLMMTDRAGEDLSTDEMTAYFRQMYQSAAGEADLIILELGCNDILGWPNFSMSSEPIDMEEFLSGLRYNGSVCEIRNELMKRLTGLLPSDDYDLLPEEYQKAMEAYLAGYMDATVGMDQLIACIQDRNPNAKIVVAGVNNVVRDTVIRLSDEFVFPYGKVNDVLSEMVNAYRRSLSPYAGRYYFADVDAYDVKMIAEELMDPVATHTEDADYLMHIVLDCMGVDLQKVSYDVAASRVQELYRYTKVEDCRTQVPMSFDAFYVNPKTTEYLETGCAMTDEERRIVAEAVVMACNRANGCGMHPSAAGYQAKFKAFQKAIEAAEEKPALVYNLSSTVDKIADVSATILKKQIEVTAAITKEITASLKKLVSKIMFPFDFGWR